MKEEQKMFNVTEANKEVFGDKTFSNEYRSISRKASESDADFQKRLSILKEKCIYKYRCCDADGEWYFMGYSTSDSSFAPLAHVGADYGCIYIEYYNEDKKEWEML